MATCGLVTVIGCYSESTIDQVNELPQKGTPGAKTARAASRPAERPTAGKPSSPPDPKAQRIAEQTRRYVDRVSPDKKGPAAATRPSGATGPLAKATVGDSKRAVHVADDAFEASKPKPTTAAKTTEDAPWRRSVKKRVAAKPKPGDATPKAPVPQPPPATPKPKAPPAKATPAKARPAVKTPPATEIKPPAPAPAAPAKPKVEPSEVKPVVSPKARPKPGTPGAKGDGFVVPKPPSIPKLAKDRAAARPPGTPPRKPKVTVKAAPKTRAVAAAKRQARPNLPAGTTPPAKADIQAVIQQKLKEVTAKPNDLKAQMALRLLYLADNQPEKAMAEIPGTNSQIQQIVESLMKVNAAAVKSAGADTAMAATQLLAQVEQLRGRLRVHADLEVASIKLCSKVERFGIYDEIKPLRFLAGRRSQAIVYCEVRNFSSVPTEDSQYRVLLAQKIKVLDANGETVHQTTDDDVPYTSRNRIEDFFLVRLVELPTTLRPGKYILRIYVEDKLAGKAQEGQIEFTLTGGESGG